MKLVKTLFAVCAAGLTLCASAADLTFDLAVRRGAPAESASRGRKQTVAVFVIDCSGSMRLDYTDPAGNVFNGPAGEDKTWSREKLVAEKLLPERFAALPRGTQVYVFLYGLSGEDWLTEMNAVFNAPEAKAKFLKRLRKAIRERVEQDGATPYYDAMEKALVRIRKANWMNDPKVSLMLFDYTDGLNATGVFSGFSYPSNHGMQSAQYMAELAEAKKLFNSRWGDFLKEIAKKGFYEQLNVGSRNDNPGVKQVPAYQVAFSCGRTALKSPRDAAAQKVALYASFPVNQESWELLKKAPAGLKVRFGGGQVRRYPVSLQKAVNAVKVPVPAEAMGKATKVTVFFDSPKGVPGKFTLAAPAPVTFVLAAPKRAARSEAVASKSEKTRRSEAVSGRK